MTAINDTTDKNTDDIINLNTKPDLLPPRQHTVGIIDYILFLPFFLTFFSLMLFFELVERILFKLNGITGLDTAIYYLCRSTLLTPKILFWKNSTIVNPNIYNYKNRPILIASNHQSLLDISLAVTIFKDWKPRFIAKRELAQKFIPGTSFYLNHGKHALIDRADSKQAIPEIKKLAEIIPTTTNGITIFPEGTRSRDGSLKDYKSGGIAILTKVIPDLVIIPMVVDNGWRITARKRGPIDTFQTMFCKILEPIDFREFAKANPENTVTLLTKFIEEETIKTLNEFRKN